MDPEGQPTVDVSQVSSELVKAVLQYGDRAGQIWDTLKDTGHITNSMHELHKMIPELEDESNAGARQPQAAVGLFNREFTHIHLDNSLAIAAIRRYYIRNCVAHDKIRPLRRSKSWDRLAQLYDEKASQVGQVWTNQLPCSAGQLRDMVEVCKGQELVRDKRGRWTKRDPPDWDREDLEFESLNVGASDSDDPFDRTISASDPMMGAPRETSPGKRVASGPLQPESPSKTRCLSGGTGTSSTTRQETQPWEPQHSLDFGNEIGSELVSLGREDPKACLELQKRIKALIDEARSA